MNRIIREDIRTVVDNCAFIKQRLNGKSILITGATGMLLSYMVYTLEYLTDIDSDFKVTVYIGVRDIEKAKRRFGAFLDEFFVHIFDADLNKPFDFTEHTDFIIHGASLASSDMYLKTPVEVILPNILGTYNLLELARREKCEGFLFFSSGAIYGKVVDCNIITERDSGYLLSTDVRSCYGESKRLAETLCASYAHEYGIRTTIVRPQHTYGPTMDLNDSRVFAEFVRNILNNQNIEMKSDGSARRTFCYLSDAVNAFWRILLLGEAGEAYNLCNNSCFISIENLADIMTTIYPEKKLKVIRKQRTENDTYAEDKNANTIMYDDSKLKNLGWNPTVSIKEGFYRTCESFMV